MTPRSLILGAVFTCLAAASVQAAMGAKTIFDRLDADHDGTVSRAEVVAAAQRKYDLISKANGGHVTLLALGGRLSKSGVESITKSDEAKSRKADPDGVTREQYVEQTEKAFDQAKFGKSSDDRHDNDNLTLGELSAPSAGDLIGLLE